MVGDELLNRADQGTEEPRLPCALSPAQLAMCGCGAQRYPAEAGTWHQSTRQNHLFRSEPPHKGPKAESEAPLGHLTFRCPLPQISLNPLPDYNLKDPPHDRWHRNGV